MENRLKECIQYLIQKRRLYNASDLAKIIGKQSSYISEVLSGKREANEQLVLAITNAFPEISYKWLLYGRGEMVETSTIYDRINSVLAREGLTKREFEKGTSDSIMNLIPGAYKSAENNPGGIRIAEQWVDCLLRLYPKYSKDWLLYGTEHPNTKGASHLIPIYDSQIIGDKVELTKSSEDSERVAEWIDAGDWFPQATAAFRHYGDSMLEYPSGCFLTLKVVNNKSLIISGQIYVIETDEYRVAKIVHDEGDHLTAYSSNSETMPDGSLRHKPFKVSKDDIRRLFIVLGCVIPENTNKSSLVK